ncbi:unnamed protein product [Schistocephalus solidus]|uniref:Uncharacterized protein n=1 Tax=Schistocephalus solidus TaxID=70667 RepID=A0A183T8E9_SCHSO|nr:unnamed protein product [Schistocephalus solidus]
MDDERLHKQPFYGDVTTGAHRQGGQKRSYKETLKKSLKQLQINPATWEDQGQKRRYKDTLKKSLKQLQINPVTWEDLYRIDRHGEDQ